MSEQPPSQEDAPMWPPTRPTGSPQPKQPGWWAQRSKKAKTLLIGAAVLVGLAIVGSLADDKSPDASSSGSRSDDADRVTLLADNSLCLADASMAKIHFRITLRNDADHDVSVNGTPWRRYSDNSVNDSTFDELTMDVPAYETVTFSNEFGYDAEKHNLIECGMKMEGDSEPTKFAVVQF